jgi:hypothetical protein
MHGFRPASCKSISKSQTTQSSQIFHPSWSLLTEPAVVASVNEIRCMLRSFRAFKSLTLCFSEEMSLSSQVSPETSNKSHKHKGMESTPEQAVEGLAIVRVLSTVLDRLVSVLMYC